MKQFIYHVQSLNELIVETKSPLIQMDLVNYVINLINLLDIWYNIVAYRALPISILLYKKLLCREIAWGNLTSSDKLFLHHPLIGWKWWHCCTLWRIQIWKHNTMMALISVWHGQPKANVSWIQMKQPVSSKRKSHLKMPVFLGQ